MALRRLRRLKLKYPNANKLTRRLHRINPNGVRRCGNATGSDAPRELSRIDDNFSAAVGR
jgi:hypothetical protein